MLASSFLDPVLGIDVHWELVPMPAPTPVPIPNPFTGIVFDPIGLAAGLAIGAAFALAVGAPVQGPVLYWGFFPATNTGTEAIHIPGHILFPPGVFWAPFPRTPKPVIRPGDTLKPPKPITPDNDAVAIFGSKTVSVMGSNAVRFGDILLSCSEPIRLPSSVVLAVPKGRPILIGGPMSLDIMAAVMASLRTRFMSDSLHALVSRLSPGRFRNFLHRAVCFFTGHPVDVASGKVISEHVDFALSSPLPLQIDRVYSSAWADRAGRMGNGWSISLDQAVWRERGKVVLRSEDGREIEFDSFDMPRHRIESGQSIFNPVEGLTLRCLPNDAWEIEAKDGVVREFAPIAGDEGEPGALGPTARIVAMRDRTRHHRNVFSYDARGCLEWVRDALGRYIRIEHDAARRITALVLQSPQGDLWTTHRRYRYDEAGDLVEVEDATGARWRFEYCTHLLTRETDRTGFSWYFVWDGFGADAWCTRTWGDGGVFDHKIAYDKKQHITFVTDSLGNTTEYRMNAAGLVTKIREPLGGATEFAYDPVTMRRTRKVDAAGRVTAMEYDARGNMTKLVRPDGAELEFTYDSRDLLVQGKDPIGGVWRWRYDEQGQQLATSDPLGQVTTFGWANGLPAWVRSPGRRVVEFEHDAQGQLRVVKDGSGFEKHLSWDQQGRQTRIHEVGGATLSLRHDQEGRLIELSRPSGERQRRIYDAEGNVVAIEDGRRSVRLHYGAAHRVIACEEEGELRRFEYDTEGRLRAHVDAAGRRTAFDRDPAGRVVRERKPDGGVKSYKHDVSGRIVGVQSPAQRTTSIEYDKVGRVTRMQHSDGTFTTLSWRADGGLLEAVNESSALRFELDALGRTLREISGDGWVQSQYGPDSMRTSVQSSYGLLQEVERDRRGSVRRMMLGMRPWSDASAIEIERDAAGHEIVRRMPGNIGLTWQRDDRGRACRRHTVAAVPAAEHDASGRVQVLEERRWHWQGDDRLVTLEDVRRGAATHYDYDGRGRVVRERRGERSIERAHDAQGNVYRQADRRDREYAADGQLTRTSQSSYDHDANGQRIRRVDAGGATWSFAYDERGMLRAIDKPDGQRIEYQYDALGRRTRKVRIGEDRRVDEEVRYLWDGRRMVHESRGADDLTSWYWSPHDTAPVAKRRGDRLWSIAADHMGNPTEMYDEHGRLTWQAQLDIYGQVDLRVGTADDCPWRWPGQYEDTDAELCYNGFRYYDAFTGNYTRRDPLGLAGNTNPYGYPANPWAYSDPLGLETLDWMAFMERADAWNLGEGVDNPMSDTFKNQAFNLYNKMLKSSDIPIIGEFGDVDTFLKKNGPGFAKLSLPMPPATGFHWNTFVNDMWLQAFIDNNAVVRLASEPTEELLSSKMYGRSVFGREMDQLIAAGYKLVGKLGDKKDPLRMEPPCR
ncbi:DUF6531 domain-containing protein [Polyangium mundeleinium]|uniref:DUF6531 domain-containing protein n=1 Tax=Polyangium mundeleinium TaxID=2995306 RepID=A0ABT5F1E7_9BACT|nr:DUF6531 domain-containing protein [Polyangium mundeleinium]MDC0747906.1 DUF6531 domain-containing protein [Polyangium mundeleinium]